MRFNFVIVSLLILLQNCLMMFLQLPLSTYLGKNFNGTIFELLLFLFSDTCENKRTGDNNCGYWSWLGECSNNHGFMEEQCAKSCDLCQQISNDTSGKCIKLTNVKYEI